MKQNKKRKVSSIKNELIAKSRESMMCAVQVFNNPNILFKSESFIVLSIISWTYLLHAHYRELGIDYRYFEKKGVRKKFDTTKNGAKKHWSLERCLDEDQCPIDKTTKLNIKFLIGLRHEIEHQMTTRLDDHLSARFQACCLNYNDYLKKLFGDKKGIDKHLSFSLQFSTLKDEDVKVLEKFNDLPKNISKYIDTFDAKIPQEEFNNPKYSYGVIFVPRIVNHKNQADKIINFVNSNSQAAKNLNTEYCIIKEKKKYKPGDIVKMMKDEGYKKFNFTKHTGLWQLHDAKDLEKGYGTLISGQWYWYANWVPIVRDYCKENRENLI